MAHESLKKLVRLVVESRLREVDLLDGSVSPFGSDEHIEELNAMITKFENKKKNYNRGSVSRSDYSKLIARLRTELKSAIRFAERSTNQKDEK
jgi:hypothetical protein